MRPRLWAALIASFLFTATAPRADEGMWTFDNPPLKLWKERYNFEPSASWLEHVRLASVRLSDGGSGSFVSRRGLVMTNQHVAASQLQKASTPERNLVRDGFYARTEAEEIKCADLEINVLVGFEDMTRRVRGAVKPGATDTEAAEQRRAEISRIEKTSTDQTGLRSEVVTLYNGGEYWLYQFKRYTDVRLVFAPEEQTAFFGGDYDNFTFPRHDLDIAFLRAYENGRPAEVPHYFAWSAKGPADGEFVVISGNPGSTDRLMTMAQLRYQRDTGNPLQKQVWTTRREILVRYSGLGQEQARRAASTIRSLANSLKRLIGQQDGLLNPRLMGRKEEEETKLRQAVANKAEWQRDYGDAWNRIELAYRELPGKAKQLAFATLAPSRLGSMASTLVRYAEEIPKPNDRRYEEFQESKLETLKFSLLSPAPMYPDLEEANLAGWLAEAEKILGPSDPFVRAALSGSTPAEAARIAVRGTTLADAAARKTLLDSGPAGIAKSQDPLLALARRVEPVIRDLRAWQDDKIRSVETAAGQKIAEARFAVYGKSVYPDANFSLRLGYGKVLGYEEDTTLVPFMTTFYGLYDRAFGFQEKPPYNLPPRVKEAKDRMDLSTPLNFVYSGDTIGGNSGSPVINRNGEIVGLNFDSNVQKLPNRYMYIDESEGGRAVAVHSAGIIEGLRIIYGADRIVSEILGK
jgi:hypothetical protein